VKPINIPLVFHCKLSSSLFLDSKEESDYMSNILHAIGVVNGHMEKPSKYYGNGCFSIIEAQVSPITYSGCSDLFCGYVDSGVCLA